MGNHKNYYGIFQQGKICGVMIKRFGIFLLFCVSLLPSCRREKFVVVVKDPPKPTYFYYIPEESKEEDFRFCWKEMPSVEPVVKYEQVAVPAKISRYNNKIMSYDIPNTSPKWNHWGPDLKYHIYADHGIEMDRMSNLSNYDLVRLHSYVHNGGRKFGGF